MAPVAEGLLTLSESVSTDYLKVRNFLRPRPDEQLALLLAGQALDALDLAGGGTLCNGTGSHLRVLSWLFSS